MGSKNNRIIRTIFMLAAMVMLLAIPVQAQASAKSTYNKGVTYYKKGKYSKARKEFKKLKKNASESCVKNMSQKMKSAYLKKLKQYVNKKLGYGYVWAYYLTDIDKDGKAELIIKYGTCEADCKATVYKYKSGKAKKIGSFYCSHSTFYYDPRGNGMIMRNAHMFAETICTVRIKNGKIKTAYWRNDQRSVKNISSYMSLPYALDEHVSYDKNYKIVYDYSPLK